MDEQRRIVCKTCGRTDDEIQLEKCPICYTAFCDEHAFAMSGRRFCGPRCADYFFFGDEEDEGG